jgi:hypothetical protein
MGMHKPDASHRCVVAEIIQPQTAVGIVGRGEPVPENPLQ